jgi:hypothetical protein
MGKGRNKNPFSVENGVGFSFENFAQLWPSWKLRFAQRLGFNLAIAGEILAIR